MWLPSLIWSFKTSEDPKQFDQGLHCFLFCQNTLDSSSGSQMDFTIVQIMFLFPLGSLSRFRPHVYKTSFMLNSVVHEIFSANKYENANNSWHFHINKQKNFHAQLCLVRKNLQLLVI